LSSAIEKIPKHLHKYIVEQNYDRYTYEDQEVWRFVMRQLKSFLIKNAHAAYEKGLSLTGISVEEIPKISVMDDKLKKFGWRAVPVSGFIPPAAFMEFQAHGILPIASDMRTIEHILYTPAPDIVHEAAGHAPILIDPEFSQYLKNYAEVASKSIISSEDLNLYEAIRNLSDIKESTQSNKSDIDLAETNLKTAISNMTYVSEAQLLGRMNWWTAEYGLIGELENPKIFGAGLLSSIGESRLALKKPKLIPLDIECLNYSYDITEPQPQLFVAQDFKSLNLVLNELANSLAYKKGGLEGLEKAKQSKTVCTVITNSNLSYSGILLDYKISSDQIIKLNFKGPVQFLDSSPSSNQQLSLIEDSQFEITFGQGTKVISVHGGPINTAKFPSTDDFVAARVPDKKRSNYDLQKFEIYKQLQTLRKKFDLDLFLKLKTNYLENFKSEWLIGIALIELACATDGLEAITVELMNHFSQFEIKSEDQKLCVDLGLALLKKEGLLT
jgi:phenylalanine-4-hydroxylase